MKKTILATMIISIFFAFTCTASATTSGGQTAAKSTPASTDTVSLSNDTVMPASGSGITMVFKENEKYYCKGWAFAPRKSLIERQAREKIPYDFYVEKGLVIASGERVIDYNEIEEFICTLEEKYDVKNKSIAYDRQFSAQLIQRLQNKSFECVEVAQSFTGLTNATRILSEKVLLNDFYYLENPLMEVQITNCRIVRNMSNQIIINKKQSNGKIDIIASLINTFVVLEEPEPEFFIV